MPGDQARMPEEALRAEMQQVGMEMRLAVALRFELGMNPAETAEVLGCSSGEAEILAVVGLQQLHHRMACAGWERLPAELGVALGRLPPSPVPEGLRRRLDEIVSAHLIAEGRRGDGGLADG